MNFTDAMKLLIYYENVVNIYSDCARRESYRKFLVFSQVVLKINCTEIMK
jgi:hypothetical protein